MTTVARVSLAGCAAVAVALSAAARQPAPPPGIDTVTTAIPGVVKAGVTVKAIKSGFTGTEGPIGLPDGSLVFTETQANRITRIDANDQTSTFLENTNGSNGLAWNAKGRLISVQTTPGKGWNVLLRLYGPLEPWFNKSWKPADIELID